VWLGLDWVIWVVLVGYFITMIMIGWWSRRVADTQEGYLVGNRRFGVISMIMHAFGAGTNPGDAAGVISKTVAGGASGIWVSWMWMFGTPFYWLIAPIIRRMRALTMADYFHQRFSGSAAVLYVCAATVGMTVCLASVLLATTRTVQGMMGMMGIPTEDNWFFGILLIMTIAFMLYGYWGGIVAAVRTDVIQGFMIIILSFIAVPAALGLETVGSLGTMNATVSAQKGAGYLDLFGGGFSMGSVILLCINAPLVALALPHLVTVAGAGKTVWESRVGFACGNMLKRICTIGWSVLGLAWLAHLCHQGTPITSEVADAAFGDSIRHLLPPLLQGLMLACVMAAAMSSGDAFQVTVAGLISQNIYRQYINPKADDKKTLLVTKIAGLVIVFASLGIAIHMRDSVVRTIMVYFNILALTGIPVAIGLVWRRMNTPGVFASILGASLIFYLLRNEAVQKFLGQQLGDSYSQIASELKIGLPIATGIVAGIVASLLTRKPDSEQVDRFFSKIYTPVGSEDKLGQPLDEAVPPSQRLCTAGGLFIVKPARQSWVGFLAVLAACVACVVIMLAILKA